MKWNKRSAVALIFSFLFLLSTVDIANAPQISHYARASMYFWSKCSMIQNETQCETSNCYWWDDSCHSYLQTVSGAYPTQYCIVLDKDVTLCVVNENSYYVIVNGGQ